MPIVCNIYIHCICKFYVLYSYIELKEIQNERMNEEAIDNLEGCRSGQNTIKPKRNRSGGIFMITTLTGLIVELKEYIHAETPTEVIKDAVEAFSSSRSHINYFERLEALGYDNMCNLQKRIHSLGRKGHLTELQAYFWTELLHRTFVDSFHIAKHKCELCSVNHPKKTCCLDGNLTKFKEIRVNYDKKNKQKRYYTKINDEVK